MKEGKLKFNIHLCKEFSQDLDLEAPRFLGFSFMYFSPKVPSSRDTCTRKGQWGRDLSKGHQRYDFDVTEDDHCEGGGYLKFLSFLKVRTVVA